MKISKSGEGIITLSRGGAVDTLTQAEASDLFADLAYICLPAGAKAKARVMVSAMAGGEAMRFLCDNHHLRPSDAQEVIRSIVAEKAITNPVRIPMRPKWGRSNILEKGREVMVTAVRRDGKGDTISLWDSGLRKSDIVPIVKAKARSKAHKWAPGTVVIVNVAQGDVKYTQKIII